MKKKDQTIIIVGAGAAGLMAAKRLSKRNKIIILEANERIGGRILTEEAPGFTQAIEGGAEFIHGKLPLTLKLLRKAGISYHQTAGRFYHAGPEGLKQPGSIIQGWDKLLKQMKKEETDMTLRSFLEKHYPYDTHQELWRQATDYAEGFDVADISKASMKSLYAEWSHETGGIYRVQGGYRALVNYLADECKKEGAEILTGKLVTQVDWTTNKVIVNTSTDEHYMGEKCIVTTPLALLQSENPQAIHFNPSLSDYGKAASMIGYGSVIKIMLEFNEAFWNEYASDIGFILSHQRIPTWWTQLPERTPLLTGWKGGPGATELASRSQEELLELGLSSLAHIFKRTMAELQQKLVASKVYNWYKDPFAWGAYSYSYPASDEARRKLNEPVADTIYFAGEALYDGVAGGTVEAALENGKEVAKRIRE